MGPGLADDILQGAAAATSSGPRRCGGSASGSSSCTTAARTTSWRPSGPPSAGNATFGPSEANAVIDQFNRLDEREKQDLLNFLRSL